MLSATPAVKVVLCLSLLCLSLCVPARARAASDALEQVKYSVVLVNTYDGAGRPQLRGSGFFIARGIVATSAHVLRGAASVKIVTRDGRAHEVDGVTLDASGRDLALLRAPGADTYKPLELAAASPRDGAAVTALGNQAGAHLRLTHGSVEGRWNFQGAGELLRVTAQLGPGSSGGPVVDAAGQVVGVATMCVSAAEQLSFAVPAEALRALAAEWVTAGAHKGGEIGAGLTPRRP